MPKDKTYNPYCIVNYFYAECWNFEKILYCKDCIFENCVCKKVRVDNG